MLLKSPAAELPTGILLELAFEGSQFLVYVVDHGKSQIDGLAAGWAQVQAREPFALIGAEQARTGRTPLMVENRLNALLPGAALIHQGLTEAHDGAKLLDVFGRDPGFGQAAVRKELPQVTGVVAIVLGPALGSAQGSRIRRLGQMSLYPGGRKLLYHKAPAGGRFQGDRDLLILEAPEPLPKPDPRGRTYFPPADLSGLGIKTIESDLVSVHVKPAYNTHWDLLELEFLCAAIFPH
jgi:hypothetical protein